MVPELSVILHLAHVQHFQAYEGQNEGQNRIPYAMLSGDGGFATWNAITDGGKVKFNYDSIEGKPELDVIKDLTTVLERCKE